MKKRKWKFKDLDADLLNLNDRCLLLSQQTGLSPLVVKVCLQRGLSDPAQIQDFFSPKLEGLKDPFLIRDMDCAIERLIRARDTGQRIRVFGDYDVDGTTGAALLSWFFRETGFQFDAVQPDRFRDGYGLNVRAVEEAASSGVQVLLTVDCGISSFDAAQKARELGLDLIIVDHHQVDPARGLPCAVAVVNPQREDCSSGLRELCGCALAFYLIRALRTRGKELNWWAEGREPNLKKHLDLVVMATAADMVPLVRDNRILAKHGLDVLRYSKKPGIQALFQTSGLKKENLSTMHLGFVIGPRINASGRMASASLALELLTTENPARALELAQELESLNQERSQVQNLIWEEVKEQVELGLKAGKFQHAVVVASEAWHEGVLGIVASRVVEAYQKPAIVIAIKEGLAKGSVRSFGGKDVLQGLRDSAETLLGFGGHKFAAGLSLKPEQIEKFAGAFDQAMALQTGESGSLWVECFCSLEELNFKALQEFEALGPFGPGNPEPVFAFRAAIKQKRILKGTHLKLSLSSTVKTVDAIWFNALDQRDEKEIDAMSQDLEWAAIPELNRYQGRVTPTLRVKDLRDPPPIDS